MNRVQDPQADKETDDSGETTHPSSTANGTTRNNAALTHPASSVDANELNNADQGGRVGDETEEQKEFRESLAGNRGTMERLRALYNDFKSPRIQGSDSDGYKFRPEQFLDWLEQWPHNKDENTKVIKEIRAIDFEKEITRSDHLFLLIEFGRYLVETEFRHMDVINALETLCDFSQKTDASLSTPNSGTKRKHNGEPTDNPDAKDAAGVVRVQGRWAALERQLKRIENYPFREMSRLELSMIDGLEVWKTNDSEVWNIDGLRSDDQAELKKFNRLFQSVFNGAIVISSGFNNNETKKAFRESLEKLEDFLTGSTDTTEGIQIPDIGAPRVDFAQPFVLSLMRSLGNVANELNASIHHDDLTLLIAGDDTPVETPTTEDDSDEHNKSSTFACLLKKAEYYLACLARIGFQFRGVGVDRKATGIVMTPSCMRIIQLELVDVGRPEVRLIVKRSPILPFLTEANFEKRFEGSKQCSPAYYDKLKSKLYPPTEEKSEVPEGITALWNIMSCSRQALVGPSKINDNDNDEEGRIGDMISCGACATIHQTKVPKGTDQEMPSSKKCKDQVIKLPRVGSESLLEKEAGILQELAKRASQEGINEILQQSIATCVEFNKEEPMTVNDVKMTVPALVLSPRGMSSHDYIQSRCKSSEVGIVLREWSEKLSSALCHIHRLGFFHNDISPMNIMVKPDANDGCMPFLIDFALASAKDEYMVGFVGTPRFTHSDIFKKRKKYENDEEWKSKPEYDFCALALTLAALTTQGLHLWDSFPPSNYYCEDEDDLFESWVDDRGDVAWERLQYVVGLNESSPWKNRCYCCCSKDSSY